MRSRFAWVAVIVALPALANECVFVPPCFLVKGVPNIYLATVISTPPGREVIVRVDEIFRGKPPKTVRVLGRWELGHQYLIYDNFDRGEPVFLEPNCNQSGEVSKRQEDIRFLRDFVKGKTATIVTGSLEYDSGPATGVTVAFKAGGREYRVRTDAKGEYSLTGLPGGEYSVEFRVQGRQPQIREDPFLVTEHACHGLHEYLEQDPRVNGKRTTPGR